MEARVNIVTLGVGDLQRAVAFYRDGLGWPLSSASSEQIAFFQTGGIVLALYPHDELAAEANMEPNRKGEGFSGFTLAQNVAAKEQVSRTLREAEAAGATIVKEAQDVFWGGHSGYFADPDGHLWEVAYNPYVTLAEDGNLGPEDEIEQEHVVFDSQGRLSGEDLEAALEGSDLLVAPTMPDYPEIKALARFAADVEEASEELRSGSGGIREPVEPAPYRVLLTMVPWYERLHSPGRSELEKSGVPLFKGQIEARKAFKHAAAMGAPVYEVKGGAAKRGWEDYVRVGKELIGELEKVAS